MTFAIVIIIYDFLSNHIRENLVNKFEADLRNGRFVSIYEKHEKLKVSSKQSEVLTKETMIGILRSCRPPKSDLSKRQILISPNKLIEILGIFSLADLNYILRRTRPSVLSDTKYSTRPEEAKMQVLIRWMEVLSIKNAEFIRQVNSHGFSKNWDEIAESIFGGLLKGIGRTEKKVLIERGKKIAATIPHHRKPVIEYFIKKLSKVRANYISNAKGQPAGSVSRQKDGRFSISVDENADFTSVLMSSFVVFAEDLSVEQKLVFSKWARLPTNEWSSTHREQFALAAMHLMQKAEHDGIEIADALKQAAQHISEVKLPPLRNKLSPEICAMINGLFCL